MTDLDTESAATAVLLPAESWVAEQAARENKRSEVARIVAWGCGKGLAGHDALYLPAMRYPRVLFVIPLLGCSLPAPKPPAAEFLVADGSSTYWVRSGPGGISSRTSPLILTSADNRLYEVFVDEVTRSYEDAIFTREPIYSRDLLTGRKKILFEDAKVSAWEKMYLSGNPEARLLDPDEDGSADVTVSATGESDILGVAGPYVLFNQRITLEKSNFQHSDSSRGAIDIRSGEAVPITSLVRDTAALGAGGVREGNAVTWRHAGYDVVARNDTARAETVVVLRDRRGHEWPLGYVDSRLPRIFWLDQPRADTRLRTALNQAFEDAREHGADEQFASIKRKTVRARLHLAASHRTLPDTHVIAQ